MYMWVHTHIYMYTFMCIRLKYVPTVCEGAKSEHLVRFVELSPLLVSMLSLSLSLYVTDRGRAQENITRSFLEFLSRRCSSTVSLEKILHSAEKAQKDFAGSGSSVIMILLGSVPAKSRTSLLLVHVPRLAESPN